VISCCRTQDRAGADAHWQASLCHAEREAKARPARLTEERAFDDILTALRQRTGVDFTYYKRPTLERRIQRRMVLHKYRKLRDYAAYLRSHATEARELFNDILIHVTSFFRDPAVFTALKKKVFPRILKGKTQNDPIRIWIPGCSTGEVYSIAMTLLESLSEQKQFPIQIFGTDINEVALEKARAGLYPECIHEDVSRKVAPVLCPAGGRLSHQQILRQLCIFARQKVVGYPRFSNLDLIFCRNVLIYLGLPLQRKIMPIFHYALKPTGLLLLGASETISGFPELFGLRDGKAKVYFKKATHFRHAVTFQPSHQEPRGVEPVKPAEFATNLPDIQKHADRLVLTHYSPAGVIINREMQVLQFRGRTGPFFEHGHGEANLNLLKMAREGLTVDLRSAVSKAMKQGTRVRQEGARVKQNVHFIEVAIEVVPFQVPPSREQFYVVLLDTLGRPTAEEGGRKPRGRKSKSGRTDTELSHLREELAGTRESLHAIIEEQEATNEELRSANEEIMSSNEELQSTTRSWRQPRKSCNRPTKS
jgi:two-component system CheB/CheR fusion protein